MYEIKTKNILTPQNGFNIYCGRTENTMWINEIPRADSMDVGVKIDADALLEETLRKRRTKSMLIAGNLGDPYNVFEENKRLMRSSLMVLEKWDFGISITTRSNLILRDIDILKDISQKTKCVVDIPFPSANGEIMNKMDGTGNGDFTTSFDERINLIEILLSSGIPVIIDMDPIIPELNDSIDDVLGMMKLAVAMGVKYFDICGCKLIMKKKNEDFFYSQYEKRFSEKWQSFKMRYHKTSELITLSQSQILRTVTRFGEAHNIETDSKNLAIYRRRHQNKQIGEQMTIYDI